MSRLDRVGETSVEDVLLLFPKTKMMTKTMTKTETDKKEGQWDTVIS